MLLSCKPRADEPLGHRRNLRKVYQDPHDTNQSLNRKSNITHAEQKTTPYAAQTPKWKSRISCLFCFKCWRSGQGGAQSPQQGQRSAKESLLRIQIAGRSKGGLRPGEGRKSGGFGQDGARTGVHTHPAGGVPRLASVSSLRSQHFLPSTRCIYSWLRGVDYEPDF